VEDFATAMKAIDPSIKIIANGKSGWWQTILQSNAVSKIDFLGLSEYPVLDYAGGYDYYRENDVNLTHEVDLAIADIKLYAGASHKSRIKVIVAEYNSIDWNSGWPTVNNLGHALANFQMFGDMVVKPEVEAACMWNTRWVENAVNPHSLYDAFDSNGNQNAVALSIDAWGSNLLDEMVETTDSSRMIESYASYDGASKHLNIFLLNKEYAPAQVNVSINNYVQDFKGSVWQLHGSSVSDKFPEFARTDSVFEPGDINTLTLPANSVTILKLQRDDVTLPITINGFQARKNNHSVELNWETTNERNISSYVVEKSSDGLNFISIGTVSATNKDASLYQYVDGDISNSTVLYYRLLVVEANGNKVSSRVVSVTVNMLPEKVAVQPNPFGGSLMIKIKSETEKNINIILTNLMGRIVLSQQKLLFKGNNVIELTNLDRLMKGLYLLKIVDHSFSNAFKVVKR
jgi:hypothetical protein